MHLKDGNSKHGTVSVCPRKDRVYTPGHRPTRCHMYDLVAGSSDNVRQTAVVSCSTEFTSQLTSQQMTTEYVPLVLQNRDPSVFFR